MKALYGDFRLKKFILLSCILSMLSIGYANAFNLNDAYKNALSYNSDYLNQIAQNKAGQENVVQARSGLLPQLSGTAAFNETYLATGGMSYLYHQPTAGVSLSQTLFDWNKFSAYTKGKYATQLSDFQLQNAKQQLIVTVAQAYFALLYASDTLQSIQIQKDALKKQMDQAEKSFSVGTTTIADVNDAKAGYDAAVAQEISAQNDLINQQTIFRNLTGLNPDLIQPLNDDIHLVSPSPNKVDAWSTLAKDNNLNIKMSNLNLAMAKEDISIAKAGHMPSINLVGTYSYSDQAAIDATDSPQTQLALASTGTSLWGVNQTAVGVQLSLPLYNGGGISSKVRQQIATYEAAQQTLSSTQRNTDQQVQNAFWQVQNGVSLVKAQTQALKSAKIKLDSDKLGYQVGVRNSVDLVNSEKNYSAAIQSYNKARYDYLTYRLQLKYLTGDINEDFLHEINLDIKG